MTNTNLWENEGPTFSENGLNELGSPVGNNEFIVYFCDAKLQAIAIMMDKLIPIAWGNPQAAFCVLSKVIKSKSTFILRITPIYRIITKMYGDVPERNLSCLIGMDVNNKIIEQASFSIGRSGLCINVNSSGYCEQLFINCNDLLSYVRG